MAITKPPKASRVLDHPYPSAWYILGANSGNKKAIRLLENCIAAMALLVWSPYVSMTYAPTATFCVRDILLRNQKSDEGCKKKTYWADR